MLETMNRKRHIENRFDSPRIYRAPSSALSWSLTVAPTGVITSPVALGRSAAEVGGPGEPA